MERIILFGGSFDPIHLGHLQMAQKAQMTLNANRVIFLVARNPRWKEPNASSDDRVHLLQLALRAYPHFGMSTYELRAPGGGHHTIDTIRHFQKRDRQIGRKREYYYLIGADQLEKLDQWHEITELSGLVHFVAYGRFDDQWSNKARENAERYQVQLLEGERFLVSSTQIRALQSIAVPSSVLQAMMKRKLYYFHEIYQMMDEKRYEHSCSVACLAMRIAKRNHLDAQKAFIAGILHDIGKTFAKTEDGQKLLAEEWPSMVALPSYAHHQFISASLARRHFGQNDPVILEAIAYHCTGKAKMTRLGRIVYASDKIDPLRGYDSSAMIKSCLNNDEKGFLIVLAEKYERAKQKENSNPLSEECFAYYLGKGAGKHE